MKTIEVNTPKGYSVLVGEGLLSQAGERIKEACGGETAFLVADDIVNKLYGDIVERSLQSAGYAVSRFVFPHGERSKNMETYTAILRALAAAKLTRKDVLAALGGGVAGDMGGFAAATYLRGIAFAQLPTSLLAMVDSSVGGKTAVDLPEGKNLAGAFYQPDIVLCDYAALDTLPPDVFHDGCAEMIKHGAILSAELFDLLKAPIQPVMEDVIARNVSIKRDVVVADEHEAGIRKLLNFGHTIGHGIEKHSGYAVPHGSAVAIGMVIASRGAARIGMCDWECHAAIVEMVKRYSLPHATDITPDQLIGAAFFDKKRSGKSITLILPERIGKCAARDFSLDELAEFIRLAMRA